MCSSVVAMKLTPQCTVIFLYVCKFVHACMCACVCVCRERLCQRIDIASQWKKAKSKVSKSYYDKETNRMKFIQVMPSHPRHTNTFHIPYYKSVFYQNVCFFPLWLCMRAFSFQLWTTWSDSSNTVKYYSDFFLLIYKSVKKNTHSQRKKWIVWQWHRGVHNWFW